MVKRRKRRRKIVYIVKRTKARKRKQTAPRKRKPSLSARIKKARASYALTRERVAQVREKIRIITARRAEHKRKERLQKALRTRKEVGTSLSKTKSKVKSRPRGTFKVKKTRRGAGLGWG